VMITLSLNHLNHLNNLNNLNNLNHPNHLNHLNHLNHPNHPLQKPPVSHQRGDIGFTAPEVDEHLHGIHGAVFLKDIFSE